MISGLSEGQLLLTLVAVAVILLLARAAGELARRLGQPEVLGELLAGFLLGPSVFGALLPDAYQSLFLTNAVSLVLSGFSWVGAILLLLVSGLEVDLTILRAEVKPGTLAAAFAILTRRRHALWPLCPRDSAPQRAHARHRALGHGGWRPGQDLD